MHNLRVKDSADACQKYFFFVINHQQVIKFAFKTKAEHKNNVVSEK